MAWTLPPEYTITREYLLVLKDEVVNLFLDEAEMRSVRKRTRCYVGLTKRILNRRMGDYKTIKYAIVQVRGEDVRGIRLCNRLLEHKCPHYRHRQEYVQKSNCCTLYPEEFCPDNAALYFQYQRSGATSFQFGKVIIKSPFEPNLKRTFKSCYWKDNDSEMKRCVHLPTTKHAEKFFSYYMKRITAQKPFENKKISCSVQDIVSPKPYKYNPITLNVNSTLYKDYLKLKDLYLEDAININKLTIPADDVHERCGYQMMTESSFSKSGNVNSIDKNTEITTDINFQNKELIFKYKSNSKMSEGETIVRENIFDLTCEPYIQRIKSSEVNKQYGVLANAVENKGKPFECAIEKKEATFKTPTDSISAVNDEDNIYDLLYEPFIQLKEPFKTTEETKENKVLDNVLGNHEKNLQSIIEQPFNSTQESFHEKTSDKNVLENASKCVKFEAENIEVHEKEDNSDKIVLDNFIQDNAETTMSQRNEHNLPFPKEQYLYGDIDIKKDIQEAVSFFNDYKNDIENNDIKDENKELQEKVIKVDKIIRNKPSNTNLKRNIKLKKKNKERERNFNSGNEIKVDFPTNIINTYDTRRHRSLHNFKFKETALIKTGNKKNDERMYNNEKIERNKHLQNISDSKLMFDNKKLKNKEYISNSGSESNFDLQVYAVIENYPKNVSCFNDLVCPDNMLISNETTEITTKKSHEMYVNVDISNQDVYGNQNMLYPKMDKTYKSKKLEIHKDQRWRNIFSTKFKDPEIELSSKENVYNCKIINSSTKQMQTLLNVSPHNPRCINPLSFEDSKLLKRKRIPKPSTCVRTKLKMKNCTINAWLNKFSKKSIYKTQSLNILNREENHPAELIKEYISADSLSLVVGNRHNLKEKSLSISSLSLSEGYADKDLEKSKRTHSNDHVFVIKVNNFSKG